MVQYWTAPTLRNITAPTLSVKGFLTATRETGTDARNHVIKLEICFLLGL